MTECRKCDGTGRIEWFDSILDIEPMGWEPCPVCGGMTTTERADVLFSIDGLPLCTRAELWAAIERMDRTALDVAHAAAREELSRFTRDYGYDAASAKHRAAWTQVRALLGMEAET